MAEAWTTAQIGSCLTKTELRDPRKKPEAEFVYVDVSSVDNSLFRITNPSILKGTEAPSRARKVIRTGDVIYATVRPTLKRVAFISPEFDNQICSTGFCVLRTNETTDGRFLYYSLLTDSITKRVEGIQRGASYPAIRDSDVKSLPISVPPFSEQRRIAGVLTAVQRAVEEQERLISLTGELKKALMHKLFTRGPRNDPQKQSEIGPIPQSWKVVSLKDAVEYIDYGLSEAIPKMPPPNGVKIVSTADINRQGQLLYPQIRTVVAPPKTTARLTLRHGDILFNWRNSLELIGKTTIYDEQHDPHIFASFILRLRSNETTSHNYYLKHLLNYMRERGVFIGLARRAVNQANYNRNEISVLKIPYPGFTEQREIANIIGAAEQRIGTLEDKQTTLQELFRTLLHQLMTAQLPVDQVDLSELKSLGIEVD